jgi:pimeloyl-ACP methyl ester carboxylesterase
MTGWLNQDFVFGKEVVPSLSSIDTISSQASSMENILNSAGGNGYILIGHSDGGLVSRAAAQYYQANNIQGEVGGVTTVDSPNQGADIALWSSSAVAGVGAHLGQDLWDTIGCGSPYDNWGCFISAMGFDGGFAYLADWAQNSAAPVIGNITPGSSFLGQLNNFNESFTQVGVVSSTPQLWDEVRLLDDAFFLRLGCYPETWCGERSAALFTNIFFYSLFAEEIYAILEGDFTDAAWLASIQLHMLAIDGFWNTVVSYGAASDGIVQTSSQNYPHSCATQYPIGGADSHLGSTTSTYVRGKLFDALSNTFHVPLQSSCSFSLSPSTVNLTQLGGTASSSIVTGGGCKWSVVSNVNWLSITSAASGTSSGTLSLSINGNPGTAPRIGYITVGNDVSSALLNVIQSGPCTYSLSDGTVSFPPGEAAPRSASTHRRTARGQPCPTPLG